MYIYEVNFSDWESNNNVLLMSERLYAQQELKAMVDNFYYVGTRIMFMKCVTYASEIDVEKYVVNRLKDFGFKEIKSNIKINKFSFIDEIRFKYMDYEEETRVTKYYLEL